MPIKPFPEFENIHAVAIPLPGFPDLITSNVYVLGKGPLTLIDTGPKFPGSLEFIEKEIKAVDLDIKDVERIILTHGHIDHFGLAANIIKLSRHPVECFIHAGDKWRLSSDNFQEDTWSADGKDLMDMAGLPQEEMEKLRRRFSFFSELCDPLNEVSTMLDGDDFIGDGYHLRVIHTPGHSPGSICLYEPRNKVLFSGDHIIKHITPNPLMEIKREHLQDPNYQSLREYMLSLDKVACLDVRFVFTGHGEYVGDLQTIISSYVKHHRQRMDLVWGALKKEVRPLYNLIDDVFPYVPENDVFLAISEIIVHLEILINEGRATLSDPGPPALYRAL